jgi:hypothetical protein
MASTVEICNRALQKLGASKITSLTEDSRNARACNLAYEPVKQALLREHPWSCAIKRAELAADAQAPTHTKAYRYELPSDFIGLLEEDYPTNNSDWQIEGKMIVTDDVAPLYIRYIYDVTDPNEMDALFREALSCKLALELCEELTQSNTKLAALEALYTDIVRQAKKSNAIERTPQQPPEDPWVTVRD